MTFKYSLLTGFLFIISFFLFSCDRSSQKDITVLISPYQDLAMLINIYDLGLEEKYKTTVGIKTIPWEETYTTILSANSPADIAFASYADFLTKKTNLNKDSNDKLLFIFPAYIFRGGAFVSFRNDIQPVNRESLTDTKIISKFLSYRIGLPKNTLYQMLLFHLATTVDIPMENVEFVDVGFDSGFLAAKTGSLDIAAVGLTQLTEAQKDGGSVVLNMDTLGISDITGFIVRESVLKDKRKEIENLIHMWFECVDYVFSDLDKNSKASLEYLIENAATKYTLESYKAALSQEFFPKSLDEIKIELLDSNGSYPVDKIDKIIRSFLSEQGIPVNSKSDFLFIEMENKKLDFDEDKVRIK